MGKSDFRSTRTAIVAATLCVGVTLALAPAVSAAPVVPAASTTPTPSVTPTPTPTPPGTPAAPQCAPIAADLAVKQNRNAADLAARADEPRRLPYTSVTTPYDAFVHPLQCTSWDGSALTYSLVTAPNEGAASVTSTGDFRYRPRALFTGADSARVQVTGGGLSTTVTLPLNVYRYAPCNPSFVAKTGPTFNDPTQKYSSFAKYQITDYTVALVDCTPPGETIRASYFSITYTDFSQALLDAYRRGVTVKTLTNSHSDKYGQWQDLEAALGTDASKANYAITCVHGCLTPRTPPAAGYPTAWFVDDKASPTTRTVKFIDRSFPGSNPIKTWSWNLGDGATYNYTNPNPGTPNAAQSPPAHTYARDGIYYATLRVEDTAGKAHYIKFDVTVPDGDEDYSPSMHSKMFLISKTGLGANSRSNIAVYSSANPTNQQSKIGFNNAYTTVANLPVYNDMVTYFGDLSRASQGRLMSKNYYNTFSYDSTKVHYFPRQATSAETSSSSDDVRQFLRNVQCVYKDPSTGVKTRTRIRVSMAVWSRRGVAADLWKMAYSKPGQWGGCIVELQYTSMTQRTKTSTGSYVSGSSWGVADCLSTSPTTSSGGVSPITHPTRGYCGGGTLYGYPPKTQNGAWWWNKTSKVSGGTLKVGASCPVAIVSGGIRCTQADIHTHNKNLLVDGMYRDTATSSFRKQKVVMTGSPNFTYAALRANDEIGFTITRNDAVYDDYKVKSFDVIYRMVVASSPNSLTVSGPVKSNPNVNPGEIAIGLPSDYPGLED